MTLSRRISVLVLFVVAFSSMAIAVLSAFAGRSAALNQVDDRLGSLRTVVAAGDDPVDTLLRSLLTMPTNFVAVLSIDEEVLVDLVDSDTPDAIRIEALDASTVRKSARTPLTVSASEPIRITAIDVGNGEWLVFGEGVGDIARTFAAQLFVNIALAAAVAMLGGLVALVATRSSLKPLGEIVDYAQAVAAGRLNAILPADAPTNEVRELQTSIGAMVDELHAAASAKARSESEMRDFLADVAHELRTPLTTVRAYAEVLASHQPIDDEMRQRAHDRIAHESKRMTRLIDDLLLLARLSSHPTSTSEHVDIGSVVSSHFADLKVLDPDRSVTMETVPCSLEADPALIDRLFANLASNIHRHTPATAPVEVHCVESGYNFICTIDDGGPGIDDSQLTQLTLGIERFSALRSGDQHGTGLGLHLVASIARSQGGSVTFERSPLGGLRVVVALPTTARHHSAKDV
jgi:two-component system OmpR family sensor kinase